MAAIKTGAILKVTIDPESIDGVKRLISDADLSVICEQLASFFAGTKGVYVYAYADAESDDPSDESIVFMLDSDLPRLAFRSASESFHASLREHGLKAHNKIAVIEKYTGR